MTVEVGTTLYRYTISGGKLFVHEGVVTWDGWRGLVKFKDHSSTYKCPKVEDLGELQKGGRSLWLGERNDDLAKMIFIDNELNKISELEDQIERKWELVRTLRNTEMEE